MKSITISSVSDIYKIQQIYDEFDEIIILTSELKYTGTLRYFFKYAVWALKVGGKISVQDEPFFSYEYRTDRIDFWQIRNIFFKCLSDDIDVIEISNDKGIIKALKKVERYDFDGYSFGVVFSGSDAEVPLLTQAVDSILLNDDIKDFKHEIVVCGPSDFDFTSFLKQFDYSAIRYIPFDMNENDKRLRISEKKKFLYEQCRFDCVSISHTRILFPQNYMKALKSFRFDLFTPKVEVKIDGKNYKYLDFGLIGGYNLDFCSEKRILASVVLDKEIFYFMKKRVPYIDGGLTVFNKKIIREHLYNEKIAWGEAEDVEMCANAYSRGLLIDYNTAVTCCSVTNKLDFKFNFKFRVKKIIRDFLVRRGLI